MLYKEQNKDILLTIIFLSFLTLMLLSGCRTKYKTIETHSTDTIYKEKIIKINVPTTNTITIESPCDSLGNLKPINYINTTGKVKTSLRSFNNALVLEVNIDSIQEVWEKEYKSKLKTSVIKEKVIVYKNRSWAWYSLIFNFLALGWIFRKPLIRLIKPI